MSVSTLVLLGLAVVWAIVLLPEGLKRLSSVRNGDSIRSFNRQLSSLGRRSGSTAGQFGGPLGGRGLEPGRGSNVIDLRDRSARPAPRSAAGSVRPVPAHVRRRRQEVLTVLGAAAALTLLGAVAFGGLFVLLHLLADVLLVAYVVLLTQVGNQAPARRSAPARPTAGYGTARRVQPLATSMDRDDYGPSIGRVSPVSARRIAN